MPGRVRGQQLAACRKQEGTSHFLWTKTFGDKQTEAREKSKPEITLDFCQLKLLLTKICQMTKARIIALSDIKTPKTVGGPRHAGKQRLFVN